MKPSTKLLLILLSVFFCGVVTDVIFLKMEYDEISDMVESVIYSRHSYKYTLKPFKHIIIEEGNGFQIDIRDSDTYSMEVLGGSLLKPVIENDTLKISLLGYSISDIFSITINCPRGQVIESIIDKTTTSSITTSISTYNVGGYSFPSPGFKFPDLFVQTSGYLDITSNYGKLTGIVNKGGYIKFYGSADLIELSGINLEKSVDLSGVNDVDRVIVPKNTNLGAMKLKPELQIKIKQNQNKTFNSNF